MLEDMTKEKLYLVLSPCLSTVLVTGRGNVKWETTGFHHRHL